MQTFSPLRTRHLAEKPSPRSNVWFWQVARSPQDRPERDGGDACIEVRSRRARSLCDRGDAYADELAVLGPAHDRRRFALASYRGHVSAPTGKSSAIRRKPRHARPSSRRRRRPAPPRRSGHGPSSATTSKEASAERADATSGPTVCSSASPEIHVRRQRPSASLRFNPASVRSRGSDRRRSASPVAGDRGRARSRHAGAWR
jgi:hypothetical protein